jgi:hypothetical protein
MLGSNEDSAEDALACFNFSEQRYIDPESDEMTIIRRKNVIDIETLAELMGKIANVAWDEKTLRVIAESNEAGLNPDSPSFLWMKAIVGEDGMVDVFRHFYPKAEARLVHVVIAFLSLASSDSHNWRQLNSTQVYLLASVYKQTIHQ